jgi:TonB family protein
MSRSVTRGITGRGWVWGLTGSLWVHAALLAFVLLRGARAGTGNLPALVAFDAGAPAALAPADPIFIDVSAAELLAPPPAADEVEVARPWDAPERERDDAPARTTAPREAEGRDRAAPAADQGIDGGRRPDPAFRRDRSTLHARVTDGAAEAQPSHLLTSRRSSSPQALRRERRTGVGDQVATSELSRLPLAARAESPLLLDGQGEAAAPATGGAAPARVDAHPRVARASDHEALDRGVGPLDAEAGARAFDVEARGRAADDRHLRVASNETRPGITDFSHAGISAPSDALVGRGPGSAPGAVARTAAGAAPEEYGARDPRQIGPHVSERTLERRYQRYVLEISQRVNRIREFPKKLALRLEQGETIVEFVVGTDGRLGDGPRVVKSSGFEEFDSAAMRAVLRAAPFPPMPDAAKARPLPVSLRVAFENPVVR